jgi:hypothetical protein
MSKGKGEKQRAVEVKTWDEFRETGLLWWINRTLHLFGWVIVLEADSDSQKIRQALPARTIWRGFKQEDDTRGYVELTRYLSSVIDELKDDCGIGEDNEQK